MYLAMVIAYREVGGSRLSSDWSFRPWNLYVCLVLDLSLRGSRL